MSVGEFETTAGNNLTLQIGGSLLLNGKVRLKTLVLPGTTVASGANVTLNITGDYTNSSATEFSLLHVKNEGGHIGTGGNIGVNISGNLTAMNDFSLLVQNTNGQIDNGGNISLRAGAINVAGALTLLLENYDDSGNPAGHIGNGGNISVTTGPGGDLTTGSIEALINNRNAGTIGSGANIVFDIGGDLMTAQDATFVITNRNDGNGGGVMNGNVTLDLSAANISSGGDVITDISANRGGHILGNAFNHISAAGNLTAQGALDFEIENAGFLLNNVFVPGGTIDTDATINVSATNISATTGYFQALIWNAGGGHIGGNAALDISASNGLTTGGDAYFSILNSPNGEGTPAGTIGGSATIQANIGSMSVGGLLDVVIDNTGGSIGASTDGGATINMNVSGNASVTNDATVAIYGSDGAVGGAGININGGNYNVGGTFLTYIDGNGTITFSNASAHADVLKAGVFGANGVLNVGGGILSADTELKLYASGSNGTLNFVSNVTLGGSAVKILAANTINILDGIVVTIGGGTPAEVYTNNANYTGFGGNGTTTGTFGGAGANNPQPLSNAPPFVPGPRTTRANRGTIDVNNTAELLALLDGAGVGPDGKITISSPTTKSNLRNLSRINMNGLPRGVRRMLIHEMRDRSTARIGGRRIL
jgi:hypothetical protein